MTDKMLYSESDMLKLSTSDAMADAEKEYNKLKELIDQRDAQRSVLKLIKGNQDGPRR